MMFPALRLRRDIVCQQAVELVTCYLERTLGRAWLLPLRGAPRWLPALPRVPRSDAQDDRAHRIPHPNDLTPQMQDEFIAIYRQRRAGQDG